MKTSILLPFALPLAYARNDCDLVQLSHGLACRCSETYCDDIELPPAVSEDYVVVYTSNEDGVRLEMTTVEVQDSADVDTDGIDIELDGTTAQTMLGFGGAFTDSAAYVLSFLPTAAQDFFYKSYFSRTGGAAYSMGRVPIGSTDFSRNSFSLYDENGDFTVMDDNLVVGQDYKIDMILRAKQEISQTSLDEIEAEFKIFSSIWSAPVHMKTCESPPNPSGVNSCEGEDPTFLQGGLNSASSIREEYANYITNFVAAMEAHGVEIWGISAQNEPSGNPTGNKWENTNYAPSDLASFVNDHLGPILKSAFPDVKIMVCDDNYPEFAEYAAEFAASEYIDGLGYHWYFSMAGSLIDTSELILEFFGGQEVIGDTFEEYNVLNNGGDSGFMLMTEACTGYIDNSIQPGAWERGYNYLTSILHEVESGAAGWVDWNLALDMSGGPNHAGNVVDAAILVDTEAGIFYKNPMYYGLAHFSAFVPPGAVKLNIVDIDVGFIGFNKALEAIAFRKNKLSTECVMIIANDHLTASLPLRGFSGDHTAVVTLPYGDKKVVIDMPDNTFKTILFHCPLDLPQQGEDDCWFLFC